jgi:hypothetical protein
MLASLSLVATAVSAPAPNAELAAHCAGLESQHGCSPYCGYEAVKAGAEWICMPSGEIEAFPFPMADGDHDEYCQMVAATHGCNDVCGYAWDPVVAECRKELSAPVDVAPLGDAPIIGGSGDFKYQYMPNLLKMDGASLVNCHGLVTDKDNNIYLTYQNDGKDKNCLIKWAPDGTGGQFMTGGGDALCTGTPHGLKITTEGDEQFLYHANNNEKLTKTKLDGTIVWQTNGNFGQDPKLPYRPTWHANPNNSQYNYLCDGYGSNQVYAFDTKTGKFMNHTWGGRTPAGKKGPDAPHGTFSTNHGCTFDPRYENTIVVSDRANSRFEFFNYNPDAPDTFKWYATKSMVPFLGAGTLPCNLRMYPDQDGRAITPDLAGPVGVLDANNDVISVVNVSVLLAAEQHKHPHDAMFLPNGDMVVATWAPGRISYWKKLPKESAPAAEM